MCVYHLSKVKNIHTKRKYKENNIAQGTFKV